MDNLEGRWFQLTDSEGNDCVGLRPTQLQASTGRDAGFVEISFSDENKHGLVVQLSYKTFNQFVTALVALRERLEARKEQQ
jgi:hypothetical protein